MALAAGAGTVVIFGFMLLGLKFADSTGTGGSQGSGSRIGGGWSVVNGAAIRFDGVENAILGYGTENVTFGRSLPTTNQVFPPRTLRRFSQSSDIVYTSASSVAIWKPAGALCRPLCGCDEHDYACLAGYCDIWTVTALCRRR